MIIDLSTFKKPSIKTALPGPLARKVLKKDKRYFAPCYARPYPLVAERAKGVWMQDIDGNIFLDCTAGIAVTSTGHCHPEVVKAIQDQAEKLIHMSGTDFYYKVEADLAETLCEMVPGKQAFKAYLCNSGAEAVEAAMKLARFATGRPRLIAFSGAFHGRTMGALSLTSSKTAQMEGYFPLVPGVTHVPYPDQYRHPFRGNLKTVGDDVLHLIETTLTKYVPPKEVAAIVLEPLQGEGGYLLPPKDFFKKLRRICDKHGILMICDEVQAGMGRTGKMFAYEHLDTFRPDIITMAKGIASGMPLGACLARAELMKDWGAGRHGTTFGGNPIACAAAQKTIELVKNQYMKNAAVVGKYMKTAFRKLLKKSNYVGDVRGEGLMIAIDFVTDKKSKGYNPKMASRIEQACFRKGLLILGCGPSSLRFSPSLCISKDEAKVAVDIFSKVVLSMK